MIKGFHIKASLFYLLLLGIMQPAFAEHMDITLKGNTFNITSFCSTPNQSYGRGDYKCDREYVIELVSKYNVFENYTYANGYGDNRRRGAVILQTPLYEIHPQTYAPNKSKFNIYLSESELEKIFETDKVKVDFNLRLFSQKLLEREVDKKVERDCAGKSITCIGERIYRYNVNKLKPSLTLDLSNTSISRLKSSCLTEYKQCQKELDSLNTPINRLKRFFSGN